METSAKIPNYQQLMESGELQQRVDTGYTRLSSCDLCPHCCGVNRISGEFGNCKTGNYVFVASYGPHFGEEDPLRGLKGSGTIFFSRCNLHCQFCQNHDISQADSGQVVNPQDLAAIMLDLQDRGCHNINFVSPSHVIPHILAGVLVAAQAGLHIPLVYNTGGYDALESLRLLDGVIDIYMPDMKYSSSKFAQRLSKIKDYPKINQAAVLEMYRQVGDLTLDSQGIATRGLIVRHLILPNNLAGTDRVVRFLVDEVSKNTYLNIMNQYRPSYRAREYPELNRPITTKEYQDAVHMATNLGLTRLDQPKRSLSSF